MKRTIKPWLLTSFLVTSLPIVSGCQQQEPETEASTAVELIRPAKIATVQSAAGNIQRIFPAQVAANESTALAFRVAGQLKHVHVKEGQTVTKGSLIAELDPTDFRIQLNDAEAKYNLAKIQHKRSKTLVADGLASKAEFDNSRADMLMAKANLDKATQSLKYTKLYAPYDGIIAEVHSDNFNHVGATQPIVEFQNDRLSDIQFDLPSKLLKHFDASKMSELRTEVVLDSYPNTPVVAVFKEMRKTTSNGSLSFRVTLTIEVPEHMHVLPGMNANVRTVLAGDKKSSADQALIPLGALFSKEDNPLVDNKQFVWVVNDENRVQLREVTVARLLTNGALIDQGLQEGERVIAAGTHHVKDLQVVKALTRERGL